LGKGIKGNIVDIPGIYVGSNDCFDVLDGLKRFDCSLYRLIAQFLQSKKLFINAILSLINNLLGNLGGILGIIQISLC
jgi:hypothetical protein